MKNGCELVFHTVPNQAIFEKQISVISSRYNPISLDEYLLRLKNKELEAKDVLITFDDGTEDFYLNALPVLREMHCPATVFVCGCILEQKRFLWFMEYSHLTESDQSVFDRVAKRFDIDNIILKNPVAFLKNLPHKLRMKWIEEARSILTFNYETNDPTRQLMTLSQLKEAKDIPEVTIGAHTWDHIVLANESQEEIDHQVIDTVKELRCELNVPIRAMAYPNGFMDLDFDQRAINASEKAGLDAAFSLEDNDPYDCSCYSLPRRSHINHDYSGKEIIARIEYKWPKRFTNEYKQNKFRKILEKYTRSYGLD